MTGTLAVAASLLLLGIFLRLAVQFYEARVQRWTWDFLHAAEEDAPHNGERETLLARTYQALSGLRFARLLTLPLLIPALLVLGDEVSTATQASLPNVPAPLWTALLIVAGGLVLFAVLLLGIAFAMRGFYDPARLRSDASAPAWLTEETRRVPAPLAAGAILWDWLIRGAVWFAHKVNLDRPQAHLVQLEEGLILAVGASELGGLLDKDKDESPRDSSANRTERDMVRAIQRLDETLVREVMRPLNNVTAVGLVGLTTDKFLGIARRTGYTRFPCYVDQVTNLIGYLNVNDFLDQPIPSEEIPQRVHPALFLPEVARVTIALQEMLRSRSQIAVCFDEFGGCSGLLSREDIIEEITGEIMDEYDRPETKIQETRNGFIVDGAIDLDDLAEQLGLELPQNNCDTLAGFIFQRLSRMPKRSESFEEQDWVIEVVQTEGHRIRRVRLHPPKEEGEGVADRKTG